MLTISKTSLWAISAMTAVAIGTTFAGCKNDANDKPQKTSTATNKKDSEEKHGEHAHASKGPHGGHLVELGEDEYHGELLHDDKAHTVTVYILDGKATKEVPVGTDAVRLNVFVDNKALSLTLHAVGAAEGKASQFAVEDADLVHAFMDGTVTNGKLNVTINGKPYVGKIEHHKHDHGDQEHAEHDEHNHGKDAHEDHD